MWRMVSCIEQHVNAIEPNKKINDAQIDIINFLKTNAEERNKSK